MLCYLCSPKVPWSCCCLRLEVFLPDYRDTLIFCHRLSLSPGRRLFFSPAALRKVWKRVDHRRCSCCDLWRVSVNEWGTAQWMTCKGPCICSWTAGDDTGSGNLSCWTCFFHLIEVRILSQCSATFFSSRWFSSSPHQHNPTTHTAEEFFCILFSSEL